MKKILAYVCMLLMFSLMQSCQSKNESTEIPKADSAVTTNSMEKKMDPVVAGKDIFSTMQFDNKKDFICGMPVSAGVADTANYKGKVYGFCATECKEEFLKDPESYIVKK